MKRIIVVSLILVALLMACIAPAVLYAQEKWVKVQTFTGKGDKTTALFHISGTQWRINWAVETKRPDLGVFVLYVYPKGETESFRFIEQIMHDCDGDYSDTTYIYEGNGSFYIRVECSNLKSWTIEVEDCISAAPPPAPSPTPSPSPSPSPPAGPPPAPPPAEKGGACGCFIATAAYGTDTAERINILREFRDEVLLSNSLGAQFVSFYYRISPPIADFISHHDVLRTIVREGFIDPIVAILDLSKNLWSE